MRLIKLLLLLLFVVGIQSSAVAQAEYDAVERVTDDVRNNVWKYYSYRPMLPPVTYALSRKNQINIEVSSQLYCGRKFDPIFLLENKDGRIGANYYYLNERGVDGVGGRFCISYAPWTNVTVSYSFLYSNVEDIGHLAGQPKSINTSIFDSNNGYRYQLYCKQIALGEFSATYHNSITNYMSYEVRTTFALGRGKHEYEESYDNPILHHSKNDLFSYNLFNHGLDVGLSIYTSNRVFQFSFMMDLGYTTYFNKNVISPFLSQQIYSQVIEPFNHNPFDLYCTPWVILSFNTPNLFSCRINFGMEFSKNYIVYDGMSRRKIFGLTLSWCLNKGRVLSIL